LIASGDPELALRQLESYLAKNPKDAQARFTRGLALARLNRDKEAIAAFAELIRDVPQSPEPYNNLAALLVKGGELGKARTVLEAGLSKNPNYKKAQLNLGDIYLRLAQETYTKAQKQTPEDPILRVKLDLLQSMTGNNGSALAASPQSASIVTSAVSSDAGVGRPTPIAAQAASAKEQPSTPPRADSARWRSEVMDTLRNWRDAQLKQDAPAYLALYSESFKPQGVDRKEWEQAQTERLGKRKPNSMLFDDLKVDFEAEGAARARFFLQTRLQDGSEEKNHLELDLSKSGSAWRITKIKQRS
jgi:Flp pilus assembly protein TadD